MKSNQSGFSPLSILMALLLSAGIVGVGYVVQSRINQPNPSFNTQESNNNMLKEGNESSSPEVSKSKNSLGLTATDKIQISDSVAAYCNKVQDTSGNGKYTVILLENLDDQTKTQAKGGFIKTPLLCYDNNIAYDTQTSSSAIYILKKSGSDWSVIYGGQMAPVCSQVDGKGLPVGMVQCYEVANQEKYRDPK